MMNPASTIIERFGGPEIVQTITGASRTRVYRWTQPKAAGGTDGIIPTPQALKLLAYARQHQIPVTADDFLSASAATTGEAA